MLGKPVFRQRMVNVRLGSWRVYTGTLPRVTTPTPITMFKYGEDALSQTEVLKGLQETSKTINKHLITVDNHLKLVKEK
jgi:hypothetical protein